MWICRNGEAVHPSSVDHFVTGLESSSGYSPQGRAVHSVSAEEGAAAVALLAGEGVAGSLLAFCARIGSVSLPDLGAGL
ncbi:hypothetical protein AR457_00010 [Streptomyces agglomeratus]|nr:hypothetical protein BGK72_38290 [Streptomyces agglomeratus]OEJ42750.1 hypothetical protein AR457_00010 [Streptomyces agglomeratus]OEJ55326.1 hypothetical protein BGK72_35805 [Streptomyces agglomeratus]OEJ62678.1 hypothetical protein BGM19_36655 [Streptomyces agglomeratus]